MSALLTAIRAWRSDSAMIMPSGGGKSSVSKEDRKAEEEAPAGDSSCSVDMARRKLARMKEEVKAAIAADVIWCMSLEGQN